MTNPDTPINPILERGGNGLELTNTGMSLRQYAAIQLRVPDSGDKWLDDMISKSLRTELAARMLAGMVADPTVRRLSDVADELTETSYIVADAIMKGGEL